MLKRIWGDSIAFSHLYRTAAMEVSEQDDFLNATAKIETDMSPQEVLMRLRAIEKLLEKSPPFRFGPRTIDLDILFYDELILESDTLTIPHPRMHLRRFVLDPLLDIAEPDMMHPVLRKTISALRDELPDQRCERDRLNPW